MNLVTARILLVDDDEDDCVLIRDLLSSVSSSSYELEWAASYDAAMEAIDRGRQDVCFLDYRLGERNGLDLLREATAKGRRTPVIMLTDKDDNQVVVHAMRAGATDYVVKDEMSSQ